MAEYIERDIAAAFAYNCGAVYVANRLSDSNAFPAADVAPVVHGRWINQPLFGIGVCSCSNCKDKSQIFVFSNGEISEKFCPLCGARMDGDDAAAAREQKGGRRMKIYIAGKITGDPYYKAKFARAAADIADAGHTPINPAMQPEGMSNADYMRIRFAQLDSADAVAFLPDWADSKVARIEHLLVEYTGKPMYDIKCARLMVLPESLEARDDDKR